MENRIHNPYVGWRAFDVRDHEQFYGRDEQIISINNKINEIVLDNECFNALIISSPSGVGKSSLVKGGVLPYRVLRNHSSQTGKEIEIVEMCPNGDIFIELAAGIATLLYREDADRENRLSYQGTAYRQFLKKEDGLSHIMKSIESERKFNELIIFIDQFEMLFRENHKKGIALRFLNQLSTYLETSSSSIFWIFCLREEYRINCFEYPILSRLLKLQSCVLLPMGENDLYDAISEPAKDVGFTELDSGVVSYLAKEFANRTGALPLLQFILYSMYKAWAYSQIAPSEFILDEKNYGAELDRIITNTMKTLDAKILIESIFIRGIYYDQEMATYTRKRVLLNDVITCICHDQDVLKIIENFNTNVGSLISTIVASNGQIYVEPAHESVYKFSEYLSDLVTGNYSQYRALHKLSDLVKSIDDKVVEKASSSVIKRYRQELVEYRKYLNLKEKKILRKSGQKTLLKLCKIMLIISMILLSIKVFLHYSYIAETKTLVDKAERYKNDGNFLKAIHTWGKVVERNSEKYSDFAIRNIFYFLNQYHLINEVPFGTDTSFLSKIPPQDVIDEFEVIKNGWLPLIDGKKVRLINSLGDIKDFEVNDTSISSVSFYQDNILIEKKNGHTSLYKFKDSSQHLNTYIPPKDGSLHLVDGKVWIALTKGNEVTLSRYSMLENDTIQQEFSFPEVNISLPTKGIRKITYFLNKYYAIETVEDNVIILDKKGNKICYDFLNGKSIKQYYLFDNETAVLLTDNKECLILSLKKRVVLNTLNDNVLPFGCAYEPYDSIIYMLTDSLFHIIDGNTGELIKTQKHDQDTHIQYSWIVPIHRNLLLNVSERKIDLSYLTEDT